MHVNSVIVSTEVVLTLVYSKKQTLLRRESWRSVFNSKMTTQLTF